MDTNKKIGIGVATVIILAISFYAGIQYNKSNTPVATQNTRFAQGGNGSQRVARGGANGGGFVSGTILSQDATGITIKLRNSGSQIVLVASSTQISKSVAGSAEDLKTGEDVMISGSSNPDGSLTAESIQIRQQSRSQIPQ